MIHDEEKKSTRNIILLGIVSFLNDFSSEMILPILPLLIQGVGGTGLAVGLIGGLRDSGAELLKALFGHLSDRRGKRKSFIYAGYLTSAFFKLLLPFAHSWRFIFILVGLERIGKAIRTAPRNALIAQSAPKTIGLGFGIHQALDSMGALLGSVVTFFLIWQWNIDFKLIIFVAAIIGIASIIPLNQVTEVPIEPNRQTTFFNLHSLPPSFKIFTAIASLFSLGHISYMFLILQAQNILAQPNAIALSMLLYALFNLFYALLATPFGMLSDIIGRRRMVAAGYILFSSTMFSFFIAKNMFMLIVGFILYGVALAIIQVNHRAFAADLSPHQLKASALGIFEAITGLVTFMASIIAGIAWEFTQHNLIFFYAGVLALCAGILIMIIFPQLPAGDYILLHALPAQVPQPSNIQLPHQQQDRQ